MKMILAICPEKRTEELSSYIEQYDIHYYSELHGKETAYVRTNL